MDGSEQRPWSFSEEGQPRSGVVEGGVTSRAAGRLWSGSGERSVTPSLRIFKETNLYRTRARGQGPGTALKMGEARKNSSTLSDRRILESNGLCGLGQVT
ncbi:unnamed protein product [Rangifer tarandus platyrhynchus]|uniref:Uncharacterized protein n=1 Tax=Rangifer tarandus platyrhynchus TaxID=3082113 RepID=A0ABN9A1B3_RANTA|nr:unnamed protein product [Rangifer tarandus platyrhynchus]